MVRKRAGVEARLAAAEANVDKLLADPLALFYGMQRSFAALVCAEIDKSQQQPLAATRALLRHFVHAHHQKRLKGNAIRACRLQRRQPYDTSSQRPTTPKVSSVSSDESAAAAPLARSSCRRHHRRAHQGHGVKAL